MLLLFFTNDAAEPAGCICRYLRRQGASVFLASASNTNEHPPLPSLPFTAALMLFRADRSTLPAAEELRQRFPGISLFSLCICPPRSGRWYYFPEANHEFTAPFDPKEILCALVLAGALPANRDMMLQGLYLPATGKRALIRGTPFPLTENEKSLIRALALAHAQNMPAKDLAGFIALPLGCRSTPNQVAVHISGINRRAAALGYARPIVFIHGKGYKLENHPPLSPSNEQNWNLKE